MELGTVIALLGTNIILLGISFQLKDIYKEMVRKNSGETI